MRCSPLSGTFQVRLDLPGKEKAAIQSIAVLPFENASRDPNLEYLSDGIAESLINSLTQLQQFRYTEPTAKDIAYDIMEILK